MDNEAAGTPELIRDISAFLRSTSLMNQAERYGILNLAFSGEKVLERIDFQGAVLIFVPKLVESLVDYGRLPNGKHSLIALLEAMKEGFGTDRWDVVDRLCERIQNTKDFRLSRFEPTLSRNVDTQWVGYSGLDAAGLAKTAEGGVTFTAVILRQTTSVTSPEAQYIISQSEINLVHSQGIEEGRKLERQTLTQSLALADYQAIDQEALRLRDEVTNCIQNYDMSGAFEHARSLENHLNGKIVSLSPRTLTLGFEVLANIEILKHKIAGEAGDTMALGRAGEFLGRAKDAARRS